VVSETGETLSPKVAPPRIAPIKAAGAAPNAPPAGYRSGAQTSTVPRLVPVAVETTLQIRKAATTKPLPSIPARATREVNAGTKPLAPIRVPRTPARIQARTMVMTIGWLIPRR